MLLHGGFFALIVLAVLTRAPPREPGSTDGFAVEFMPAEDTPPGGPPTPPAPLQSIPQAIPPAAPPAPPLPPQPQREVSPPPPPPAAPRLAEPVAPLAPVPPLPDLRFAEAPPPPAQLDALPLPPPPPPAPRQDRPQQEASIIAPPRPARPAPPPTERLPGLWLPDGARLAPSPRPDAPARRGMDLSLNSLSVIGRNQPEAQVSIRGATVGDDWRRGFRRWLDENVRYPANAAAVGDEGVNRIQLLVAPDGRVKSWRIVRRSGSVWLDAGLEGPFRNAVLPAFPPGADPDGVEINLTVHWNIIRR